MDEFDVGYKSVDTWHGGNPGPALSTVRQALIDANAICRLRPSATAALERRDVRWAVHHNIRLPKPLSEHRIWEVTNADRFEGTISRFLQYPQPLDADVRDRITDWAARPETNAGAPERGRLPDDFIAQHRGLMDDNQLSTVTDVGFRRWSTQRHTSMRTDFTEQMWRWLNAEGALRELSQEERVLLGPTPVGTRVWDRVRLAAELPELTRAD
ncbi:hypothetical protein DEJ31_15910 [Curtobacterium sp. MCPF17_031]|nr:hypothetical protein DEJ31_15910 [Curtobacterium sp. MCPF17_031]